MGQLNAVTKLSQEYETLTSQESWGSKHNFGIKIQASAPHGKTERLEIAAYKAREIIEDAIKEDIAENDTEARKETRAEIAQLIALFNERIYVEEIPNGYCSQACCRYSPWLIVTTSRGRIKIGWRKRVIHIDWEDSRIAADAEQLFPKESVTKYGKMIHAWGYEDAERYLTEILKPVTKSA